MKMASPYLMFDGSCKEAINHYARCFKTEAKIIPSEKDENRVMHASIQKGTFLVMASDWDSKDYRLGNNSQIYVECESRGEVDELFKSLGEGGQDQMKPDNTFWGSYFGSVTDKYGVCWMMGYDEPKK